MKIGIIGAGISGLSLANLLDLDQHDVTLLERAQFPGGIARPRIVNEIPYHVVGGHCFNSKNKEVMDFVFSKVLEQEQWHKVKRNSKIFMKNHFINYPIEYSLKEIASFDTDLAFRMLNDIINSNSDFEVDDLEKWFRCKFGNTLAEEYFIPYNEKIWGVSPAKMSPSWVEDKLPVPNKFEIFQSLVSSKTDNMSHSSFYYPNTNTQTTFIDALADEHNILLNYEVKSIEKIKGKWHVNGEKVFDLLISTMPLNCLPRLIKDVPVEVVDEAEKLVYNRISNVLWESDDIDNTWTYYPEKAHKCHRHIHIGNFLFPSGNYTITEYLGARSAEEIIDTCRDIDYLLEPIDSNISEHAYVIFDKNAKKSKKIIFDYLEQEGLFTLGRFGEWEYYNMDICIEKAIKIADKVKNTTGEE